MGNENESGHLARERQNQINALNKRRQELAQELANLKNRIPRNEREIRLKQAELNLIEEQLKGL